MCIRDRPMIVPQMSPTPPVKGVPPITTEAMTSSSEPMPNSGMAVIMRAERKIEASAAQNPVNI